jgi:hypothetical protein
VHLVEAGLVEDRGRVAGRGRHRRPELIQVGGAGGVGFQHGLAHVVHQLDQEQLLVHRGHRVGDQLLAYVGEPGGGQQGGQAGTDGRVAPVEADGGAVDLLQPIQGWRRGIRAEGAGEQVLDCDHPAGSDRGPHGPQRRHRLDQVADQQPRIRWMVTCPSPQPTSRHAQPGRSPARVRNALVARAMTAAWGASRSASAYPPRMV